MLSNFSVKKPMTVFVSIIIVLILGVVSFTNMVVDLIPSINMPYVIISTTYAGASPELVETTVTHTIEQTLGSVSNVEQITSVSQEHVSLVIVEFTEDTNMDSAMLELRENLDLIADYLPETASSPMMIKLNPNMMPMMASAVYVDGQSIAESSKFLDDKIIPEIESVEGVGSVTASGILDNMVYITLSEEKIAKLNSDLKTAVTDAFNKSFEDKITAAKEEIANKLPTGMTIDMLDDETLASMGITLPTDAEKQAMLDEILKQIPTLDMTKDMLGGILSGQNFAMPSGQIVENGNSYVIRTGDKFKSVEELSDLTVFSLPANALSEAGISLDGFDNIKLNQIAEVVSLTNADSQYVKLNGNDGVLLTIQKQSEYSTADVSSNVISKMNILSDKYDGVKFSTLMDQGDYVNIMINGVIQNLLIGAVIAIFILLLFLKSIRSTFIVGSSIFISVLVAITLMYFSGISMNVISMGGLALGIGMLVDNSIVVIENIFRLKNEGMSTFKACRQGAKQVSGAITASTITTIIVFVPILFTTGITKTLFLDMGLTIAFSLVASLITALTFVPAASSLMLKKNTEKKHKLFDKIRDGYGKALAHCLKHKWIVSTAVVVMLVITGIVAVNMDKEFFPETDMGEMSMSVSFPDGYKDSEKTSALDEINTMLTENSDIETVGIMMVNGANGGMMSMMGGSGDATIYALLKQDRNKSTAEIASDIRQQTENKDYTLIVSTSNMDITSLTGSGIAVELYGQDLDELRSIATDFGKLLEDVDGLYEIDNGLGKVSQEIRVTVNKEKSIAKGLTVAQVYMAVSNALKDATSSSTIETAASDYDIYVYDDRDKAVDTMQKIKDLTVTGSTGEEVKVGDIADVGYGEGFASIRHQNNSRYLSLSASVENGFNAEKLSTEVQNKLNEYNLPDGYSYKISGESESTNSAFNDLYLMLIMAIVFIYLVMVAQFQSLLSPFIVMFTIPLAFTGGILFMGITGTALSIVAMIGLIVLTGIVVNNGIVFVDYVNQLVEQGMEVREALVKTGRDRLRPIIMTALTTICALLAMFLDTSATSAMTKPLAVATIGGLLYATILTLFFVPVIYDLFHRRKKNKKNSVKAETEITES